MKKVFAISGIILLIGVPLFILKTESDKKNTLIEIQEIKLKGAEARDSISDYYLMVRKMMAKGYDQIEAEDYTKRVMDKNDQKYFDSIYFNE